MLLRIFNCLLYSGAFRFIVKPMLRSIVIFSLILFLPLPASADAVQSLQALVQQKKFRTAIRSGEQLLLQLPQQPRVKFLTAYAYQMNRQADKAEALYRQLISQYPQLPEPRNNLAMIYQAKGDYDAASKLLVEAIETHESYATAYRNLNRIYTGIASEAYRRALSESSEPPKSTRKIELTALGRLILPEETTTAENLPAKQLQQNYNREELSAALKKQVEQWARAWSDKDFTAYTNFYSTDHRPNFKTHSAWIESRRQRIMRPGFIEIGVSDMNIRVKDSMRAIVDFKQSFNSPGYSDQVIKRLEFRRVGKQWRIVKEKVLSVL